MCSLSRCSSSKHFGHHSESGTRGCGRDFCQILRIRTSFQVQRYTHQERQATLTGGLRDGGLSGSTGAVVVNIAATISAHYYTALQGC